EAQRHRVVGVAHEAGHTRGVADHGPAVFVQIHTNEHVAGNANTVHQLALTVLDLNDVLGRDLNLVDVLLHVERLTTALNVGLDALLEAGVRVDDVPLARQAAQFGAECGVGVVGVFGRLGGSVSGLLGSSLGGDI